MSPLQQLQVKIRRSADHLADLENELNNYLQNSVTFEWSLKSELALYTLTVSKLDEMPLKARILAGEVLTHLRSALDHLVWQLALLKTPSPTEKTEFPIFLSEEAFKRSVSAKIGSISDHARDVIEELQPFRSAEPKKTKLWRLHRLANIDKHRLTTIVVTSVAGMGVQRLGAGVSVQIRTGPISNGMEIGHINFSESKDAIVGNLSDRVGIMVLPCLQLDGDDSMLPAIQTLREFGSEVELIVRRFETLLQ